MGPAATRPGPSAVLLARCAAAGVLAGLASLVPGVSGGTMILAAGVYPQLIAAVAEVSSGRLRRTSVGPLAVTVASALAAVFLVAGAARDAFTARPGPFFALFLGLTLGGAPLLWRMAGPKRIAFGGAALGGALAVALPILIAGPAGPAAAALEASAPAFFGAGAVAAFAMLLPGVSGSTLLLLMGMYLPFLNAVDRVTAALVLRPWDPGGVATAAVGVIPFLLGIALGIAVAARLVRYFLAACRQPTLGALFGLLLGATAGLWPFQTVSGIRFDPTGAEIATASFALVGGFCLTALLGGGKPRTDR